jgi:DNA-binding NarL/FixJ family response regulator
VSTTQHSGAIRILTVDDHQLLREGIAAVLDGQDDMTIVGQAADAMRRSRAFDACART